MELTEHEKLIVKKQKYDVIRYYRRQISISEKRIEFLESEEYGKPLFDMGYKQGKEQTLSKLSKEYISIEEHEKEVKGLKDGFDKLAKIIFLNDKISGTEIDLIIRNVKTIKRLGESAIEKNEIYLLGLSQSISIKEVENILNNKYKASPTKVYDIKQLLEKK